MPGVWGLRRVLGKRPAARSSALGIGSAGGYTPSLVLTLTEELGKRSRNCIGGESPLRGRGVFNTKIQGETKVSAIAERLQNPFDPDEVKWKPQVVQGNRAMVIAYIDARVVMDRLDDVFGIGNWQTSYRELPDGVVCQLRVKVGDQWCEHEDVGSYSDQPDEGDKLKAGFSDALKRAAVHLGIGRYLYRLPKQWVDYDPQKRRINQQPTLPAWAMPSSPAKEKSVRETAIDYERSLVAQRMCVTGDLVAYLEEQLGQEGMWERSSREDLRQACLQFLGKAKSVNGKVST